ncbi:MAG: phosphotriesterase [Chloroflexi bacterium]|nr:MAG: phosphotriesterase [Chloroflexota bacterium]
MNGKDCRKRRKTIATVQTVTDPIDTSEMGFTLIHEHLRVRSDAVVMQWPYLYDEKREMERAIGQVRAARERGVKTIVEPTVMGLGRDIRFMQEVGRLTSMQIIPATGLYTYNDVPFYFHNRSVDKMADLFIHDIEEGIQGTSIRATFLKCATDEPGITPGVEQVLRAVARAHRRTGVPIMTHSHPRSGVGLKQQDILEAEGVDLSRVLIGHSGDTDDIDYLTQLVERGSFIGMDRYGLEETAGYLSTEKRNATILEMCRRGYVEKMMLSQDTCCTIDWFEPEVVAALAPKWNMTYITDEVIPALKAGGITDAQIHTMTVDNPRRYFERQGAY